MRLAVLLSCMFKDLDIIRNTNIQSDIIIVNQCEEESINEGKFQDNSSQSHSYYFISSKSRGLSKSRNIALSFAKEKGYDICVICDDDEFFPEGYEKAILSAYDRNSTSDIITFAIDWEERHKPCSQIPKRMGLLDIFQTSSQQITFKLSSIVNANITFDEKMGSGTGNGGSEEIKFLMDSRRKNLKLYYEPFEIAKIKPDGESQWFKGYTLEYLEKLAWSDRRAMGSFLGYLYIWGYCLSHYKLYKESYSFFNIIKTAHRGYFSKR